MSRPWTSAVGGPSGPPRSVDGSGGSPSLRGRMVATRRPAGTTGCARTDLAGARAREGGSLRSRVSARDQRLTEDRPARADGCEADRHQAWPQQTVVSPLELDVAEEV